MRNRAEVRDLRGASRAVGYLALIGGTYGFVLGLLMPQGSLLAKVLICGFSMLIAAVGVICLRWPHRLPGGFWTTAPFTATALITTMNVISEDSSTGSQLFYLWPILYAAMYQSRRLACGVIAAVATGQILVDYPLVPLVRTIGDAASWVIAATLAVVVVMALRDRADRLVADMERQSLTDPLTGLTNRRGYDRALASAERVALIAVDLDNFKTINDTWGHGAGDQALQAVADAMRAVTPDSGVAARVGGDEFALILQTDAAGAGRVADALRARVAAHPGLPCGPPGLSIGIAVLPGDATTVEELLAAADRALYRVKATRRRRRVDA